MASMPLSSRRAKSSGVETPPGNRQPMPMIAMGSIPESIPLDGPCTLRAGDDLRDRTVSDHVEAGLEAGPGARHDVLGDLLRGNTPEEGAA